MIDVNQFVKKIDQWALVAKIDKKQRILLKVNPLQNSKISQLLLIKLVSFHL